MDSQYDIAIIGGGAAGLMAATETAGLKTVILEKMPRPARKILLTGKGRCNITNTSAWNDFCRHVHPNPNPLKHSFFWLDNSKTLERFNAFGLETVTEHGNRAYPASMKAVDVVDTLHFAAKSAGAEILCNWKVSKISFGDGRFTITGEHGGTVSAKAVIIATGGLSYPTTGSEGDGYAFAKGFGHKIKGTFPSLTAITPKDYAASGLKSMLEGIHLKNVTLKLYVNGDLVQEEFGEMDFTNGGIEGALGFRVSRKAVKALNDGNKVSVSLDLKPAVSEEQINERAAKEPLRSFLPARLIKPFTLKNTGTIKRYGLGRALKDWKFDITSYVGYERCVITAGGVAMEEINPKSLQSKLQSGLFFAGEVMDIDADTGGYNLQIAWSTGANAGRSAAEYVRKGQ